MQRIAVSLIVLILPVLPSYALVSTNVPLGHWSYDAVDKLANYGLIDSSMLTIKPISRVEMARHTGQAIYAISSMDNPPEVLGSILARLQEEFAHELILLGVLDGWQGDSFVKPLEDPYVKYLYTREPTGLENVRGDEFRAGSNYRAGFASRAKLFERLAFYLHPEYRDGARDEADVELIEGYGKVMVSAFEIQLGKDSLWWGPGYHGSILMSNNPQPFTMIKITNPQPLQLPWILRIFGLFRAEWFYAELEEDRDIPEAKLSGVRVNAKPLPQLELGASRVAMFGGRGVPRVGFSDYVKMFLALSEQEENNQLAGFDASYLLALPDNLPLRSVKVYAEIAGEDEAGGWPSKWGELVGLQFNDIFRTGRTDLRIEYANNHVSGFGDLFYTHNIYTSGYTYEGRVIGHHMGTDSRDVFLRLSHYLTDDIIVDLAFDRQTHNLGRDAQTRENIFECSATLFPAPDWRVRTAYRYEEAGRFGEDDNHIFLVELVRRF